MSLILEALNRSQRDRQIETGALQSDTTSHLEGSQAQRSRLSWLPWLALAFALLVIGWLLLDRFATDVVPAPSTPKHSSLAVRTDPAQVRSEGPARTDRPDSGNTDTTATPVQMPPPQRANSARASAPEKHEVRPDSADLAVAALYAGEGQKAIVVQAPVSEKKNDSSLTEKPIDIEEVLAGIEEAQKTAGLSEHSAPFLSTLSQQAKNDVPTMLYSAHDYSSRGGQSSVVINGKTLREGGTIAGGVKLDEILLDSIVLSRRGTQFRLRALNSWVNL